MALTKLTANLNTHQSMPDQPALTSKELKEEWDKAPNDIKDYINQILIAELDRILEDKVDKVTGKALSKNDFTDSLKTKLDGIEANANKYIHPDTAGNKHIPSGGSNGQILRWGSNGTAVWGNDNNTTYGLATTGANGLMSKEDKVKLNGIASGATRVVVSAGTSAPSGGSNGDIYIQYF